MYAEPTLGGVRPNAEGSVANGVVIEIKSYLCTYILVHIFTPNI